MSIPNVTANRLINPDVAKLSPSLYNAAVNSPSLNSSQANQINQIAGTVALNKELLSLNSNDAKKRWESLDPNAQEQIKSLYGDASYIPKPSAWQSPDTFGGALHDLWRVGSNALGIALGPVKDVFKTAGVYNRLINMPYLVARQVSQGKSVFDAHVWSNAYDGTKIYDEGALGQLHQQYGDTDTFVAMKTLQGLNPGQIIDAYGTVNTNIINSIAKMVDNPDQFKVMLNQFKGAQVSPGRDIARVMFNAQPSNNKLWDHRRGLTSGIIDAAYQIIVDPLTWITGGTAKVAERGTLFGSERLAGARATLAGQKGQWLANMLAADPTAANVEKLFARNDIRNTWDNVLGPRIKEYADGDAASRAATMQTIAREMPDLNSREVIHTLAKAKVFDADSAAKYFSYSEPMTKLLAGSVEGTQFFRNGIPIAKRSRMITSGVNRVIGDFFNGAITKDVLDKIAESGFVKNLEQIGIAADPIYKNTTPVLDAATAELTGGKRRLGRFMARHPGNAPIDITDEGVSKTLNVVRDLARTIYPKAHSEFFAEAFKDSTEADRVILLRGLYTQIMHNMGLPATEGGQQLMAKIFSEKFGDKVGFATAKEISVDPETAKVLKSKNLLETQPPVGTGRILKIIATGPIHPYQEAKMIGNLPWHGPTNEASLADYAFNFNKNDAIRKTIDAIGGITRSKFVRSMVDGWSTATLFPRLGIRSAIDEAFFWTMMSPGEDLVKYAQGRKIAKGITAYTGSEESLPLIKKMLLNKMGKNPAKFVAEHSIYDSEGNLVKQGRLVKSQLNGEEVWRLAKKEDIANEAMRAIANSVPESLHDYVWQAMVHYPDLPHAISNSIVGKSGLDSSLSADLSSQIISHSNLTQAYKEFGITPKGKQSEFDIRELKKVNETLPVLAHYQNFFMKFTKNMANFGKGVEDFFDPATVFIKNNGLEKPEDVTKAMDQLLSTIGVEKIDNTDVYHIVNEKKLDNYLGFSHQWIKDKAQGVSKIDSAIQRLEASLADLKQTFHGSESEFNRDLYNHIKEYAFILQDEKNVGTNKSIRDALNSIDLKTFEILTRKNRWNTADHMINADTNIMAHTATNEGIQQAIERWNTIQNKAMEWMDAQNNHMFRQPALWLTYAKLRERYAPLEAKFIREQMELNNWSKDFATEIAEKRFTEIAMKHASNMVLTYVDNPRVKSNLAYTLRTTGRFYRATEDFYRRVFRLKNVTPQVLYRLRLANIGFQSNGFIHPDQNGDPYLVIPGDNVLFHALNAATSLFSGNDPFKDTAVKQPMYNDFAMRIALGNPTFQQDAGQPSLSGPFIAVPVMATKYMLGWFGGGAGQRAASKIDQMILGQVNQNLTPAKALIPASLQRIWGLIPKGEWDQQTVSAAMQAIAYNSANGKMYTPEQMRQVPADQFDSKRADYLDQIKVTTHNILFLRGLLGLMSPISPTLMEDKGVPDYVKNAGINGLRPEFANILQAVMRNSRGQIQDPYEAALMAFTGKHPGKAIYTVARTGAQTIMVNKSQQTQQWLQSNANAINKHGDAALIFAPNVGNYDTNVYTWMESMGMIKSKTLKEYFRDVQTAEDRSTYMNLNRILSDGLTDPSLNAAQRQSLINQVSAAKTALKARNPYLEAALNQQGYGIGKQEDMLVNLQGIVSDTTFHMDPAVRNKMSLAVNLVNDAVQRIEAISTDQDVIDGGLAKQTIKEAAIAALRELGGATGKAAPQDPQIQEAMRAIFIPILDNKARSSVKAVGR